MTVWSLPEWSPGPPFPPRRHEDLDVGACVQPQLGDGEEIKICLQVLELLVLSGDHRAVAEVPQPNQPGGGWDGRSWQESCRRGSSLSQVRGRVGNVEVFFNFLNFSKHILNLWHTEHRSCLFVVMFECLLSCKTLCVVYDEDDHFLPTTDITVEWMMNNRAAHFTLFSQGQPHV